jgi:hypothetical protein
MASMTGAIGSLAAFFFLIADEPGRGDDPSGAGGVVTVVGIALLALLIALGALFLITRLVRRRRDTDAEGRTVRAPLPSEEGRPWSSER